MTVTMFVIFIIVLAVFLKWLDGGSARSIARSHKRLFEEEQRAKAMKAWKKQYGKD